ncbi:MAG: phosphatase PAP2 family protein [Pseudomonadota bacterium]
MDTWLLELFNRRMACPLWDGAAVALTTVGLALLPALVLPLWRRRRPLAMALLCSQGLGLSLGLVLQELIGRPRPAGARLLLGLPSTGSFPSGHAVLCVAAAAVLWCSDLPRRWRWAAALLAVGVALSRVAVGHHWPSDVLAGALLGVGVGLASQGLFVRGERGLGRLRWLLWPQAALVAVVCLAAWLGLLRAGVPLPLSDKSCHFLLFGGIAFWLALGWEDPGRAGGPARGPLRLPLAVLVPFALALAEEGLQGLSPIRTFDLLDLSCDLGGMALGWALARGLWWWARRPWTRAPSEPPACVASVRGGPAAG